MTLNQNYKYIRFVNIDDEWRCMTRRGYIQIGKVQWYPHWGRFCFMPLAMTVFSADCLADIINFIQQLASERDAS